MPDSGTTVIPENLTGFRKNWPDWPDSGTFFPNLVRNPVSFHFAKFLNPNAGNSDRIPVIFSGIRYRYTLFRTPNSGVFGLELNLECHFYVKF
jgi:hypothetical protein